METYKKHGVYEIVPLEDRVATTVVSEGLSETVFLS
jgi:hypothetical protein